MQVTQIQILKLVEGRGQCERVFMQRGAATWTIAFREKGVVSQSPAELQWTPSRPAILSVLVAFNNQISFLCNWVEFEKIIPWTLSADLLFT